MKMRIEDKLTMKSELRTMSKVSAVGEWKRSSLTVGLSCRPHRPPLLLLLCFLKQDRSALFSRSFNLF